MASSETIDCSECCERLELHVLGALAPGEMAEVDAHLASCSDCRREAQAVAELVRGVSGALSEVRDDDQAVAGGVLGKAAVRAGLGRTRRFRLAAAGGVTFLVAVGACVLSWFPVGAGPDELGKGVPTWRYHGVNLGLANGSSYPLVCGDSVLAFESRHGGNRVIALDRFTGNRRWRAPFPVAGCALAANSEQAFVWRTVEESSAELVALDLRTGAETWAFRPESGAHFRVAGRRPLTIAAGRVCWLEEDILVAVEAGDGTLCWRRDLDASGPFSRPVASGKSLFLAFPDGVVALDASEGSVRWRVSHETAGRSLFAPLVCVDKSHLVVVSGRRSGHGRMRCYDPGSGTLQWERPVDNAVDAVTLAGQIYLRAGNVEARDAGTGCLLWVARADGCSPVAVVAGQVYALAGREQRLLTALEQATGRKAWERTLAGSCSGLVVIDGTGYFSGHDGLLYALPL